MAPRISVSSANQALVAAFGSKHPRRGGMIWIREGGLNFNLAAPVGLETSWVASFSWNEEFYFARGATSQEVVSEILREVTKAAGREASAKLEKALTKGS